MLFSPPTKKMEVMMKEITWLIVILWTITASAVFPRVPQTEDQHQKHQQHEHSEAQQKQRDRDRWLWQLPQRLMNVIGVKPGKLRNNLPVGSLATP
jgi:hypothetical protein